MEKKKYICRCGREFNNSQAFNCHQGQCAVVHPGLQPRHIPLDKHGSVKRSQKLQETYALNPNHCASCGAVLSYKQRNNTYCSRGCAAKVTNTTRMRVLKSNDTSTGTGELKCPCCDKSYARNIQLSSHIYRAHKDYSQKMPYFIREQDPDTKIRYSLALDVSKEQMSDYMTTVTQCEICGKTLQTIQNKNNHFRSLCVDHEHNTNHFRGLLCMECNSRLGWFETNADMISLYLQRNIQNNIPVMTNPSSVQ